MFGFSSGGRLNGQQMLSQQMQSVNQDLMGSDPTSAQPGVQPGGPQQQMASVDPQKIMGQVRNLFAPQPAPTPYDPAAMNLPRLSQMPQMGGDYDPSGISLNGSTPMSGHGGGSLFSALFGA